MRINNDGNGNNNTDKDLEALGGKEIPGHTGDVEQEDSWFMMISTTIFSTTMINIMMTSTTIYNDNTIFCTTMINTNMIRVMIYNDDQYRP